MLEWIRIKLKKTKNVPRSTYLWNMINAMVAAVQSAVILAVITRTNGIEDAGIFSIAYAVASLMLFIGQYGLRRFQASDVTEQYSFGEYYAMRILTCLVMIIASCIYCVYGIVFNDYSVEKAMIVMLVCLWKVIQAFSDVFEGMMQQKGRLDISSKASALRIFMGTGIYIVFLLITNNLMLSTIVCVLLSLVIMLITSINAAWEFNKLSVVFNKKSLVSLAVAGFPLFLSYFLSLYVGNAPKYAIDSYLSDELQAYYNFIFMPTFAVQLLVNFIFVPILTTYAKLWAEHRFQEFKRALKKQILLILVLTIVVLLGAFLIGIPVLSFLFGVSLDQYRIELCIVILGGGMLAYVTYFATVITITRHQRTLIFGYLGAAILAKLSSKYFVITYGVMGAVTMYSILMASLAVIFYVILVFNIKKDIGKRTKSMNRR
jgi:O-antigen/teichoic acid export membrane protein